MKRVARLTLSLLCLGVAGCYTVNSTIKTTVAVKVGLSPLPDSSE